MSRRNPLHDDPRVSTHGEGTYGVRFVQFVVSGAPGGHSVVETVNLFPTRKERDTYARKLRKERKGSRKTRPVIETFEVELAELRWFAPVYQQAVLIDDEQAAHRYGMVRIFDTNPPVYDVRFAKDEEELRWMLAAQWEDGERRTPHPGEPNAPFDVYYFAPDELPHFVGVVELDDEDGEADA